MPHLAPNQRNLCTDPYSVYVLMSMPIPMWSSTCRRTNSRTPRNACMSCGRKRSRLPPSMSCRLFQILFRSQSPIAIVVDITKPSPNMSVNIFSRFSRCCGRHQLTLLQKIRPEHHIAVDLFSCMHERPPSTFLPSFLPFAFFSFTPRDLGISRCFCSAACLGTWLRSPCYLGYFYPGKLSGAM